MNWLMWEKMFSCFYNKFRLVNCMHYIKCAVNSSLLTLLWLLQKGCGTLDHCFITTHSIHKEGALQMYFGVIFHKTKHHTLASSTSGAFIRCALSLAAWSTQWQCICVDDFTGQCLLWWLLSSKTCLAPTLGLTISRGVGAILALFSFLTRSCLQSLSVYLAPHKDNSIQLFSTIRSRGWKTIYWSTFCCTEKRMNICVPFLRRSPGW